MARSSDRRSSGAARKILGLAFFVVIAIAVYSIVWYYLADQLRSRVEGLIAGLEAEAIAAECGDLDIRGYPFRLGVFCDSVSAERTGAEPASLTTAAFRSAAQIYRPGHIVSELDGPASFTTPAGESVTADWQSLQASTVFSTSGLQRASLDGGSITADIVSGEDDMQAEIAGLQFHTRRNGPDLDLALSAEGAQITTAGLPAPLPAFDLAGQATITDGADFLSGRQIAVEELRGTRGQLHETVLTTEGGAALRISGPFEIAEDGLISGAFRIGIEKLPDWQATLSAALPMFAGPIQTAGGVLSSLAGDGDSVSFDLAVRDGRVMLGIIPIGELPPI